MYKCIKGVIDDAEARRREYCCEREFEVSKRSPAANTLRRQVTAPPPSHLGLYSTVFSVECASDEFVSAVDKAFALNESAVANDQRDKGSDRNRAVGGFAGGVLFHRNQAFVDAWRSQVDGRARRGRPGCQRGVSTTRSI